MILITTAPVGMLPANRAKPVTCDFCKQPFTVGRYSVPKRVRMGLSRVRGALGEGGGA